jgi:hypothetical protein
MRMVFILTAARCRFIFVIVLFLSIQNLHAVDFPGPQKALSTVDRYNSFSWDSKAGGWVQLKDVKTIHSTYDVKGRILVQELRYDKNKLLEKTVYKYSKSGWTKTTYNHLNKVTRTAQVSVTSNKVTETVFRPDKSIWEKSVWEKDGDGRPVKTELFDGSGDLVWQIAYEYNEKRNCTKISYRNSNNTIAFESDFEYGNEDAQGNWTTRKEFASYADVNHRGRDVIYRSIAYAKK